VYFLYAEDVAVSEQELYGGLAGLGVLFGGAFTCQVYSAPRCVNT
jgi:hypothetical protein